MDRKKLLIMTVFLAILLVGSTIAVAIAYLDTKSFHYGKFDVDITSKGVDTLEFISGDPVKVAANWRNFNIGTGHDITGHTELNVKLQTTSPESEKYCYNLNLVLPEKNEFVYSKEGYPEIVVSISTLENGKTLTLLNNLDVTTKSGKIPIPTSQNGNDYKFVISTTKGKEKYQPFYSSITLKWYPDIDQVVNIEKNFNTKLEANIVEC